MTMCRGKGSGKDYLEMGQKHPRNQQLQLLHQLASFKELYLCLKRQININIPEIMIMVFLGAIIQRFLASPPKADGASSAPTKHDWQIPDYFRRNVSDYAEKCFWLSGIIGRIFLEYLRRNAWDCFFSLGEIKFDWELYVKAAALCASNTTLGKRWKGIKRDMCCAINSWGKHLLFVLVSILKGHIALLLNLDRNSEIQKFWHPMEKVGWNVPYASWRKTEDEASLSSPSSLSSIPPTDLPTQW